MMPRESVLIGEGHVALGAQEEPLLCPRWHVNFLAEGASNLRNEL